MGTVQLESGLILFDNGQVAMDPACCCDPGPDPPVPCTFCENNNAPEEFSVTLEAGINITCNRCHFSEGTYILGTNGGCQWSAGGFFGCATIAGLPTVMVIRVILTEPTPGTIRLEVFLEAACVANHDVIYRKDYIAPLDCLNLNDTIPFFSNNREGCCDYSGTSATIAAI